MVGISPDGALRSVRSPTNDPREASKRDDGFAAIVGKDVSSDPSVPDDVSVAPSPKNPATPGKGLRSDVVAMQLVRFPNLASGDGTQAQSPVEPDGPTFSAQDISSGDPTADLPKRAAPDVEDLPPIVQTSITVAMPIVTPTLVSVAEIEAPSSWGSPTDPAEAVVDNAESVKRAAAAEQSPSAAHSGGLEAIGAPVKTPAPDVAAPMEMVADDASASASIIPVVRHDTRISTPTPQSNIDVPTSPSPVTLSVRPGHLGDQIGVEMVRQVAAGREEFLLRLKPADHGTIMVRMHFDGSGSLRATLSADSPATLEMLRRDSAHLDRALADAGVTTDDRSFRFDSNKDGSGGQGGTAPFVRPGRRPAEHREDAAAATTATPRYRTIRVGAGLIDRLA
jgi:hypothetical protein